MNRGEGDEQGVTNKTNRSHGQVRTNKGNKRCPDGGTKKVWMATDAYRA